MRDIHQILDFINEEASDNIACIFDSLPVQVELPKEELKIYDELWGDRKGSVVYYNEILDEDQEVCVSLTQYENGVEVLMD